MAKAQQKPSLRANLEKRAAEDKKPEPKPQAAPRPVAAPRAAEPKPQPASRPVVAPQVQATKAAQPQARAPQARTSVPAQASKAVQPRANATTQVSKAVQPRAAVTKAPAKPSQPTTKAQPNRSTAVKGPARQARTQDIKVPDVKLPTGDKKPGAQPPAKKPDNRQGRGPMARDPKTQPGRDPAKTRRRLEAYNRLKKLDPNSEEYKRNVEIFSNLSKELKLSGRPPKGTGQPGQPQQPEQPEQPQQPTEPGGEVGNVPGPTEEEFYSQTPEEQGKTMGNIAGQYGTAVLENMKQFDPNNPWANVQQQGFSDQMEAARQNVMGQFERTMGPQFAREEQNFQQRMLEQGIDPNSGAYRQQYEQMKQQQEAARLNAMSSAFQLGGQYQQQGFEQMMQGQQLPLQAYQATEKMWTLPYTAQMEAAEAARQRQAEAKQAELNRQAQLEGTRLATGATVASARIGAEAQRDTAAMQAMQQYGQQSPQPSYINTAINAGINAFGTGLTFGMLRPPGGS